MRYRAMLREGMLVIDLNEQPAVTGKGPNADDAF